MICFLDTETELIAACNQVPRLVVIGVECQGQYLVQKWDTCRPMVEHMINHETICGHHVAFDLAVLCRQFPYLTQSVFRAYRECRVTDTMIRQKLIEIAAGTKHDGVGYALDDVALRTVQRIVDKENPWRLKYGELMDVPLEQFPEDAKQYLYTDVNVLAPIYRWQEPCVERGWLVDQYRQAQHDFALTLASAWGVETNQEKVDALEQAILGEHSDLVKDLLEWKILSPKTKKPGADLKRNMKAVKMFLDQVPGHPRTAPSSKFPEGQPKTDETSLEESGHPWLQVLGRYGTLNAVVSKDIPMLRELVIHTNYDSLKETGRTGSWGPNIQNLKVLQYGHYGCAACGLVWDEEKEEKKHVKATGHTTWRDVHGIRECFRPRPGYIFISADFGGLELCTWARVCLDLLGKSRMAELLRQGLDVHMLQACDLILHIPYEEGKKRKKELDVYNARQSLKVAHFGIPGGLGWRALIIYAKSNYNVILTPDEAKNLIAKWHIAYPEGREYFDYMQRLTKSGRGTMTQVRSGRVRGGVYYGSAANGFFQGLGADIAKGAMFDVQEACYARPRSPLYGVRPWGFIHDEIIAEARIETAAEAAEELSRVMVKSAEFWLEDIPIKAEPALHWIWSKAVEGQRDSNGRLVPWEAAA